MENFVGVKYYLPYQRRIKGINDAGESLKSVLNTHRWLDLMYLKLLMNMREFEREEMPKMMEAAALISMLGIPWLSDIARNSPYFQKPPEKSQEEIELEDRIYAMWEEMDGITIVIDDGNPVTEEETK